MNFIDMRSVLVIGVMALASGPAGAQETASPTSRNPGDIVVSGRPDQPATSDKTGTAIGEVPASIQMVPREILTEQGATMLRDSLYNASGVNFGGQDSKGFYDHFLIRGLNAQIFQDGFNDGDQLGGLSHSLNGVERIEVLEGPGSSLFGSGAPGGTINIIHYTPSPDLHYGASVQGGSFGTASATSKAMIMRRGQRSKGFLERTRSIWRSICGKSVKLRIPMG